MDLERLGEWPSSLSLCLRDSGQITCMASVSRGVTRGCRGWILEIAPASAFWSSVLIRCYLLDHTSGHTGASLCGPWRHKPYVAGILLPDAGPAACPLGYLSLGMTEPESGGSPSCFQRLPPQAWGLGLLHLCICQL